MTLGKPAVWTVLIGPRLAVYPATRLMKKDTMKHCPKCKRIMVEEIIKSGRKWQIVWHCLCGHSEVDREPAETGD